jgi:hypothetical protein
MLMAPVVFGEELLGLLTLDYGGLDHSYTDQERVLIRAVCKLAAVVMELDRLWQELVCAMQAMPFDTLASAAELLLGCYRRGSTIFTLGNGGSAATASHFACDLAKGTQVPFLVALHKSGRDRFPSQGGRDLQTMQSPLWAMPMVHSLKVSLHESTFSIYGIG